MNDDGKLVRDLVPDVIRRSGGSPVVRNLNGEELLAALGAKLCEEAQEAAQAVGTREQLIEELGDLREVTAALIAAAGITDEEVAEAAMAKAWKRGGFASGAWLVSSSALSDPDSDSRTSQGGQGSRAPASGLTAEQDGLAAEQREFFLAAFREAFGSDSPGPAIEALYKEYVDRFGVDRGALRAAAHTDLAANREVYSTLRRNAAKRVKAKAAPTRHAAAQKKPKRPPTPKKPGGTTVPCPVCQKAVSRIKSTGALVDHEFDGRPCSGEVATCQVCRQKYPVRASDGRMTSHPKGGRNCAGSGRAPYEGRSLKFMQGITAIVSGGLSSTGRRR